MPQVALVSDTHIPSRADEIPAPFRERIAAADRTIHAGDFTSSAALETVRDLANGELVAVAGNMDHTSLELPNTATLEVDAVTFVVTHGTGPPSGYEDRIATAARESAGAHAVGVAGHTHEVLDTVHDGVRLLNPGSVTGAPPATRTTMMTADVDGEQVDVTVHEV